MARVTVPQALALRSDRERAPEECLEGVVAYRVIDRVLEHRRDAREVPSQLLNFRLGNAREGLHDVDLAALHGGAVQNNKMLGKIASLPGRDAGELLRKHDGNAPREGSVEDRLAVRRVASWLKAEGRAHHRPAQPGHAAHAADPGSVVRHKTRTRVRRVAKRGDLRPEIRERAVAVAADVSS